MILIKGMVAASRSVFFTLCLLFILLYVFAILMTQLTADPAMTVLSADSGANYFENIPESMYSLLIYGTFLDNIAAVMEDIRQVSGVLAAIFLVFIALSALMVMNMLIGVLCEVVQAVAETEKEEMLVTFVKAKMEKIVSAIDNDGSMTISKAEFQAILKEPDAVMALDEVGVDPIGLVDFADFIFEKDGTSTDELTFSEFMDVVLEMRSSNQATVKDIMKLTRIITREMKGLVEKLAPSDQRAGGGMFPAPPKSARRRGKGEKESPSLPSADASGRNPELPGQVGDAMPKGDAVAARTAEVMQRAEAFLMAGQAELLRLLRPHPEGSVEATPAQIAWATKAHKELTDNLQELRRIQRRQWQDD